jgi:O-antigen ligase
MGRWTGDALGDALLGALVVGLAVSITLSELTLLVLAARLIWTRGLAGTDVRRWPLFWPLTLFAVWTVITAALSAAPADSLRGTKSLLTLGALWVVAASLPDAAAAQRFVKALFVALAVVSLIGIVQVASCPADGGYGPLPPYPLIAVFFKKCLRAHAFYSIYMTLAGVLGMVMVGAVPHLTSARLKMLTAAAWVTGLVALGLTLVRGAWLGFAAGIAVMVGLLRARLVAIGALLLLVAAVVWLPTVQHRLATIGDMADPTTRERLSMLEAGLRLVMEHPILGTGPGGVKRLYPSYAPPEAVRRHTSHLHNTPLQIVVERGSIGLALWLWLFAAFFIRAGRVLARVPQAATAERALIVGSIAAITTFLVSGLFEYNFGDTEVVLVALCFMALPSVVERGLAARPA